MEDHNQIPGGGCLIDEFEKFIDGFRLLGKFTFQRFPPFFLAFDDRVLPLLIAFADPDVVEFALQFLPFQLTVTNL